MIKPKSLKLIWTENTENLSEKVKRQYTNSLECYMRNNNDKLTLETDASNIGIGGVLKQNNRSVVYISRVLKGSDKFYNITEMETLAASWAMEKLEFYLVGKKSNLILDHKAIEEIHRKKDFSTPKIQKRLERFSKFYFDIVYRKGSTLKQANTLSRMFVSVVPEDNSLYEDLVKKILEIHKNYNHRKNIENLLNDENIKISKKELNEIFKKCDVFCQADKKIIKTANYVKTKFSGEIMAFDIMEIDKNREIIVGIDYFSRFTFAKLIKSKEAIEIIKFIQNVFDKFNFPKNDF
ncbi:Retrovirus-related Pol polyprotein from transposon [Dictyocoela muelleri]|nr:Retrovirus-related Pol polyprotein from transposon [Dictyocoela muelleri]